MGKEREGERTRNPEAREKLFLRENCQRKKNLAGECRSFGLTHLYFCYATYPTHVYCHHPGDVFLFGSSGELASVEGSRFQRIINGKEFAGELDERDREVGSASSGAEWSDARGLG